MPLEQCITSAKYIFHEMRQAPTLAGMKKLKKEEMFALVREYKSCELSRSEFCAQHNISLHILQYWVTIFNKTFKDTKPSVIQTSGFSLLQISSETTVQNYEITYPNGVSLKYSSPLDLDQLRTLIQLY